ncbi:MAG: fluoride efflux transporter CrcB [Gammaproteobacteria bacterium]|nr:fluoride efflux transporter CrcB [Gammaproteobacteria bacterium]
MNAYFWIMVGSALGGAGRHALSGLVAERVGETFPWGTLAVNVLGSLVIGFIASISAPDGRFLVAPVARQFVMAGLCGGFTTFSAFSLQTLNLMREGDWLRAGGNVLVSVVACLVAAWVGYLLAETINRG